MERTRTIVSAMNPVRRGALVMLTVWFEELAEPVEFLASPRDVEPHGRVLWWRAMAGHYGPVKVERQGA